MELTFSRLILQILNEQDLNLRELYRELCDLGMNITYASLYSYFTGVVVPPYDVASELLDLENVEMEESELRNILTHSRKVMKEELHDSDRILQMNLKIKPELIGREYQKKPKYLKSVIEMRANELFGDEELITQFSASGKRKLSAYVAYLIKKDFEENMTAKEEEDK